MDDASTRALLREHVAWGTHTDARVVLRGDVEATGVDVGALERFILARGGRRMAGGDAWLVPHALLAA